MKVFFVAGPYRQDLNMEASRKICKELWGKGFAAIASHTNTPADFVEVAPTELFAEGYLEIIKRCDHVIFLPNWEESTGSREEMKFVINNNISYSIWPDYPTSGAYNFNK